MFSITKGPLQKPSKPEGSNTFTHLPMQPTNTSKTVIRGQKDLKLVCYQSVISFPDCPNIHCFRKTDLLKIVLFPLFKCF